MEKQMELLRQAKKKLIIGNTHELVQVPMKLAQSFTLGPFLTFDPFSCLFVKSASHNRHKWRFFCTVLNLDERLGAAPAIPGSFYIQVTLQPTFPPK